MSGSRKRGAKPGRATGEERADAEIADLARGANGLMDAQDVQEIGRSMMEAQVEMMNSMVAASMKATASSLQIMEQFWAASLKGTRTPGDDDKKT